MTPSVSGQLQRWAGGAGYSLTPSDDSGAALFWSDPGGETRFYIREQPDRGGFTLTRSERGGQERFVISAPTLPTVERLLWGIFGADRRDLRGLPRIAVPSEVGAEAPGYRVTDPDDENRLQLLGTDNDVVAAARGRTTGAWTLVELSHYLSIAIPDLEASFESLDGAPLLPKNIRGS